MRAVRPVHRGEVEDHGGGPVAFEVVVEVDRVGGEEYVVAVGGDDEHELAGRVAADLDRAHARQGLAVAGDGPHPALRPRRRDRRELGILDVDREMEVAGRRR